MKSKLILALDFNNKKSALELVEKLDPQLCALKIGSELFTLLGPAFVTQLVDLGYKIFLDLKFYDIPNTVANACAAAANLGVWMINVHACGGLRMMQAAREALIPFAENKPLLIAVTILTSFDSSELQQTGITQSIAEQVSFLAQLSKEAGLDGVVCSAYEAYAVKQNCGINFLTVTPGIRLSSDAPNDQSRIMTPQQAVQSGSDYLVIGRSITQAKNPYLTLKKLVDELLSK